MARCRLPLPGADKLCDVQLALHRLQMVILAFNCVRCYICLVWKGFTHRKNDLYYLFPPSDLDLSGQISS